MVSPDISGFVINGGVGTSTIEMARLLIQLGYQVHVLYANRQTPNDSSFVWWQAKYLQEGIVLKPLKNPPYRIEHGHEYVRISYAVYHQLKSSKYHRIIFTEMLGGGYFCLRAKESGIEFKNTELWVIFHGPSLWHMRNNQALPMQLQQLSTNYMETQSIQLADRVLFATEHSKDQALKHLGITPKKYSVALYPFSAKNTSRTYRTCNELIFFGRIESRKGIEDFLDALVLLKSYITRRRVTPVLLGYIGLIKGVDGRKFLEKWQEENEITLQILEGKNHYDAWEEIKKEEVWWCLLLEKRRWGTPSSNV